MMHDLIEFANAWHALGDAVLESVMEVLVSGDAGGDVNIAAIEFAVEKLRRCPAASEIVSILMEAIKTK